MAQNIRTLVALVSVPVLLTAGAANAAPPTVPYTFKSACAGEFQKVADAINSATFYGKNIDGNRDGLLSKDYGGDQKTDQRKYAEAEGLLWQIETKVNDLANQGKLKDGDATNILNAAVMPPYSALSCVMGLH